MGSGGTDLFEQLFILYGGEDQGGDAVAPVLALWDKGVAELWQEGHRDSWAADLGHKYVATVDLNRVDDCGERLYCGLEEFFVGRVSDSYSIFVSLPSLPISS